MLLYSFGNETDFITKNIAGVAQLDGIVVDGGSIPPFGTSYSPFPGSA